MDERPERSDEKNPVEEVLFVVVRLVIVPVVDRKVVRVEEGEVRSVIEVVASDTVPVAVKLPVVSALNEGEVARERTLPDHRRLDPAVIRVDGVV